MAFILADAFIYIDLQLRNKVWSINPAMIQECFVLFCTSEDRFVIIIVICDGMKRLKGVWTNPRSSSRFTAEVLQQWSNPPQTGLKERRSFWVMMGLIYKTLFLGNCQRRASGKSTEETWGDRRERGKRMHLSVLNSTKIYKFKKTVVWSFRGVQDHSRQNSITNIDTK